MRLLKVLDSEWSCIDLGFEFYCWTSSRHQPHVQIASVELIHSKSVQVLDRGGNMSTKLSTDYFNAKV